MRLPEAKRGPQQAGEEGGDMTNNTGQTVKLSNRDWGGIVIGLVSFTSVIVGSWAATNVSVARLEEQVEALEVRISVLEMTIRSNTWVGQ